MIYNYLSDLLMEAQEKKALDVLIPIIVKYDNQFKGKELCGQNYKKYLDGISLEYHSTLLSRMQEGKKN